MVGDRFTMKILFSHFGIYEKSGWGRTFSLAKSLVKLGNEVILLTNKNGYGIKIDKLKIDGVRIIIFPDIIPVSLTSKGYGLLSLILRVIYVLRKKFDIVHSDTGHRPLSGYPCLINRFLYNSKYISEWWDFFGKGGQLDNKPFLYRLIFGWYENHFELKNRQNADGVVVLSKFMYDKAVSKGISIGKLEIVRGGSDIDNIRDISKINIKKKHGILPNDLVFGYIGMSNGEMVDLKPFIEVLSKNFKGRNIVFVTFGKKLDSQIINKYFEGINLIELGWINYNTDFEKLSIVDIFVLFKIKNDINIAGWPNKLGDYFACGKPVLGNLYGDVEDVVISNGFYFINSKRENGEISDKIENILKYRDKIIEKGKKNRLIASKNLSWDFQAGKLNNFYKNILNE